MADILKVDGHRHKYRLYYFDIKGRAEPIRLLFRYFGIEFEDVRIKPEDWPKHRNKAPMRQLPYLDVDKGKLVLAQSATIMRYLSKCFGAAGFAGSSKSDAARVDMYGEGAFELFSTFAAIGMAPNGRERHEQLELATPKIRTFFEVYSEQLRTNGNHYINGHITWADLVIVFVLSALDDLAHGIMEEYPEMIKYYLRVRAVEELSDYIATKWPKPGFTAEQ